MSDQLKTNVDEAKNRAGAAWDEAKDKAQFAKDQASDKMNEKYYAGKQVVREGAQEVKDKARDMTSSK